MRKGNNQNSVTGDLKEGGEEQHCSLCVWAFLNGEIIEFINHTFCQKEENV